MPGGVHVHPEDPDARELLFQYLLDPLGARAAASKVRAVALRTLRKGPLPDATVVADHTVRGHVIGEGDLTPTTARREPAVLTLDEMGVSPPVLEQDNPLPPFETARDTNPKCL